jgi:hypothetical protein
MKHDELYATGGRALARVFAELGYQPGDITTIETSGTCIFADTNNGNTLIAALSQVPNQEEYDQPVPGNHPGKELPEQARGPRLAFYVTLSDSGDDPKPGSADAPAGSGNKPEDGFRK